MLQLKNLLARTSNRLGCLGFEATKEKEKKTFAAAKKEVDDLDIESCYSMTNATFASFSKKAHEIVSNCKKQFEGKL